MYTIRQASIRSGVGVPTIRAWERRYGIVHPARTAGGYRLYDDAAIERLVQLRLMTQSGWSASEAARAIEAGEAPRMQASTTGRDVPDHDRGALVTRFIAAAALRDQAGMTATLDEMFAFGSYETVADEVLMPTLVALGAAWAEGRIDVAVEHAASATIQRRLSALFEAAASVAEARVVVGLPPGSRHELGALAFAVALRRLGTGVLYLGADVPVDSWVRVMREPAHRIAVIGVVRAQDRRAAMAVIRALQGPGDRQRVLLGGHAAAWDGAAAAGARTLPEGVRASSAHVAGLLRGS